MLFGVISMHITGSHMTASDFFQMSLSDIQTIFSIPVSMEVPTDTVGISTFVASPLRVCFWFLEKRVALTLFLQRYAELILSTLKETATILSSKGMQRLSQFVLHVAKYFSSCHNLGLTLSGTMRRPSLPLSLRLLFQKLFPDSKIWAMLVRVVPVSYLW